MADEIDESVFPELEDARQRSHAALTLAVGLKGELSRISSLATLQVTFEAFTACHERFRESITANVRHTLERWDGHSIERGFYPHLDQLWHIGPFSDKRPVDDWGSFVEQTTSGCSCERGEVCDDCYEKIASEGRDWAESIQIVVSAEQIDREFAGAERFARLYLNSKGSNGDDPPKRKRRPKAKSALWEPSVWFPRFNEWRTEHNKSGLSKKEFIERRNWKADEALKAFSSMKSFRNKWLPRFDEWKKSGMSMEEFTEQRKWRSGVKAFKVIDKAKTS